MNDLLTFTNNTNHRTPEPDHRIPEDSHRIPEAGYRISEAGHRTSETSNHRTPEDGHRIPEADHRTLEDGHRIPEASNNCIPEASHRTPEVGHRISEAGYRIPEAVDQPIHRTPEANHSTPEANHRTTEPNHRTTEPNHRIPEASHRTPEALDQQLSLLIHRYGQQQQQQQQQQQPSSIHTNITQRLPIPTLTSIAMNPKLQETDPILVSDAYVCLQAIVCTKRGRRAVLEYGSVVGSMVDTYTNESGAYWEDAGHIVMALVCGEGRHTCDALGTQTTTTTAEGDVEGAAALNANNTTAEGHTHTPNEWMDNLHVGLSDIIFSRLSQGHRDSALRLAGAAVECLGVPWVLQIPYTHTDTHTNTNTPPTTKGRRLLLLLVHLSCIEVRMGLEDRPFVDALSHAALLTSCYSILEVTVVFLVNGDALQFQQKEKQQMYAALKGAFSAILGFLKEAPMVVGNSTCDNTNDNTSPPPSHHDNTSHNTNNTNANTNDNTNDNTTNTNTSHIDNTSHHANTTSSPSSHIANTSHNDHSSVMFVCATVRVLGAWLAEETEANRTQATVRFLWDAHNTEESDDNATLVVCDQYRRHWDDLADLWYLGIHTLGHLLPGDTVMVDFLVCSGWPQSIIHTLIQVRGGQEEGGSGDRRGDGGGGGDRRGHGGGGDRRGHGGGVRDGGGQGMDREGRGGGEGGDGGEDEGGAGEGGGVGLDEGLRVALEDFLCLLAKSTQSAQQELIESGVLDVCVKHGLKDLAKVFNVIL
ncbi:hypothetical protein Pmani_027741 [Petrolisthes manimaculis]|uniref:Uncharacterized protein n=1 Tax=Petrolisthes manimaculis TaxID=1843537 RepID=A0AAE1P0S8_9EUCA|nr:hypothetical protein Pmani_027741 [Petrolisthes manimaculis]